MKDHEGSCMMDVVYWMIVLCEWLDYSWWKMMDGDGWWWIIMNDGWWMMDDDGQCDENHFSHDGMMSWLSWCHECHKCHDAIGAAKLPSLLDF